MYFKKFADPKVTLMKLDVRAEDLGRAFLCWGLKSRWCSWKPVPHAALGDQGMLSMSPVLSSTSGLQRACCPLKCSLSHYIYLVKSGFVMGLNQCILILLHFKNTSLNKNEDWFCKDEILSSLLMLSCACPRPPSPSHPATPPSAVCLFGVSGSACKIRHY